MTAAHPPGAPQAPRTPGLAVASLVFAISSLLLSCFTAIPAVICGHIAYSRINRSGGSLEGGGIALAGIVTGYITLALSVFVVPVIASLTIPLFSSVQEQGLKSRAMSEGKQVFLALRMYAADNGGAYPPTLDVLEGEGLVGPGSVTSAPSAFGLPDGTPLFRYLRPENPEAPAAIVLVSNWGARLGGEDVRVVVYSDGRVETVPETAVTGGVEAP